MKRMRKQITTIGPVELKTYRIYYSYGEFLTYYQGVNAEDALARCAAYHRIAKRRLTAEEEK